MPDSETFDAFYARTVWNVTSQMHELAGDDSAADHAIREAYAKAYQQWYQVSGYRDPGAWVLATAKDAYERRRAGAAGLAGGSAAAGLGGSAAGARDSGTWPGFFRPAARPGRGGEPGVDPGRAVAPPGHGGAGSGDGTSTQAPGAIPAAWNDYPAAGAMAGDAMAGHRTAAGAATTRGPADDPSAWFGPASGANQPTRAFGFGGPSPDGPGADGFGASGFNAGRGRGGPGGNGLGGGGQGRPGGGASRLTTRRNIIVAGVAVAALVVAGIVYSSAGGHKAQAPGASQGSNAKPAAKPVPQMLAAGRTGQRSAVPWSLVGSGWAVAEVSTAAATSAGEASGGGSYTTYLVDPEGGKYEITTSSGGAAPQLIAWSGDGRTALFNAGDAAAGGTSSYELLNVQTGQFAQLPLPAGVVAMGFTRPDGLAILAVREGPVEFRLQRYTLTGQLQASLATLPRKADEVVSPDGCVSACALSSPDGLADVWGIPGGGMEVVSNAGGKPRRLHVPDSGQPSLCMPLTWWNETTILASCSSPGVPVTQRLWLVPEYGSAPSALTQAQDEAQGLIGGAWPARQATYVTMSTFSACQGAPSGAGGLDILPLGQGTSAAIMVPGSTHNISTIVATEGKRLLVLTQTQCPGTSSLVWFNPSTGHSQTAIRGTSGEVGVIAAVPFGNGPTAVTDGD